LAFFTSPAERLPIETSDAVLDVQRPLCPASSTGRGNHHSCRARSQSKLLNRNISLLKGLMPVSGGPQLKVSASRFASRGFLLIALIRKYLEADPFSTVAQDGEAYDIEHGELAGLVSDPICFCCLLDLENNPKLTPLVWVCIAIRMACEHGPFNTIRIGLDDAPHILALKFGELLRTS
jgi:hypothetical protein